MRIPDDLVIPQQNLRALKRLETDPELARALAEALDKSSGTSETGVERVERERLQHQLSLAHKKLERTRAKLEVSRKTVNRLRARSKRLAQRNRLLTARYSSRRYTLADAFASIALRIPGIEKLVRRKSAAE